MSWRGQGASPIADALRRFDPAAAEQGAGFGLYDDLLRLTADRRAQPSESGAVLNAAGLARGPENYTDIIWRPKNEERFRFGEKVQATGDLKVLDCRVAGQAVRLSLRRETAALDRELVVVVNGRQSAAVPLRSSDPGDVAGVIEVSAPFDGAVGGKIHVEAFYEQKLVLARAFSAVDARELAENRPAPRVIEFRRYDGTYLFMGVKRPEGAEPDRTLEIFFSVDGKDHAGVAQLVDGDAQKAGSGPDVYRLHVKNLIAPSHLHEVGIVGAEPGDIVRKGSFSAISIGDDHFWLSRPFRTAGGLGVTIVPDAAESALASVILSGRDGQQLIGRKTADPAEFRFRKGENSYVFDVAEPCDRFLAVEVRDAGGAVLFGIPI